MKNLKRPDHMIRSRVQGMPGEATLKFEIVEPILRSLHTNRLVFWSRTIELVEAPDLVFDCNGIRGNLKVVRFLYIQCFVRDIGGPPWTEWHFGGDWEHSMLSWSEDSVLSITAPYCGWTILPQTELVEAVESFAEKDDMESALTLIRKPAYYDP